MDTDTANILLITAAVVTIGGIVAWLFTAPGEQKAREREKLEQEVDRRRTYWR